MHRKTNRVRNTIRRRSVPERRNPDTIPVENINRPGTITQVNAAKYTAMRRALLKVLPGRGSGLTHREFTEAVKPHLPEDLFPRGATAGWWSKTVQLDLEAKGLIVREASKPLRWRRAPRHGR